MKYIQLFEVDSVTNSTVIRVWEIEEEDEYETLQDFIFDMLGAEPNLETLLPAENVQAVHDVVSESQVVIQHSGSQTTKLRKSRRNTDGNT